VRVLLLGYGGANNTGSEIRILTIIADVRAVFGPDARITVVSADAARSNAVIGIVPNLVVQQVPHLFGPAIWRLAGRHDLLLLVEGSTFKQNWSPALLWLFLWGAWSAHRRGKRVIAYAVDAGPLDRLNAVLTRFVCARMDLIVTRTHAARDVLQQYGIASPIQVTTDTAFLYESDDDTPQRPDTVGLAPVEFYEWPVRIRLWGHAERRYHWPFYHSWDADRATRSGNLVEAWVRTARHAIASGWSISLIAMEELDQRICEKIFAALSLHEQGLVTRIYAGRIRPQQIVAHLRSLGALMTSRYHALVLSMRSAVPVAALYHDERLVTLLRELGLDPFAISHERADLTTAMPALFDRLITDAQRQRTRIATLHDSYYCPRALANRDLLAAYGRATPGAAPTDEVAVPRPVWA